MNTRMIFALVSVLPAAAAIAQQVQDPLPAGLPANHPSRQAPANWESYQPIQPPVRKNVAPKSTDSDMVVFDVATQRLSTIKRSNNFNAIGIGPDSVKGFAGFADLQFMKRERDTENRGGVSAQSVIGPDGRRRINPTNVFPWRAQCKLFMNFSNGNFIGSGTLIGKRYMITAGHCVWNPDLPAGNKQARTVTVYPGWNNGAAASWGSATANAYFMYSGWTTSGNWEWDIALVRLNRDIGSTTGWFGYAWQSATYVGTLVNIAGYPGDRDSGRNLYYMAGPVETNTDKKLFYSIDTAGGQSGSAIYRMTGEEFPSRFVIGAHAYGVGGSNTRNSGTRITQQIFNDFRTRINGNW